MDDPFRESVALADPTPEWALRSSGAAAQIHDALRDHAPLIEHIGSTSVPLRGKPIVDLQVGVDEGRRREAITALERLGYQHHGEAGVAGRSYLTRRPPAGPAVNVHVFARGSSLLHDNRIIRDYLRSHPDVAREYVSVKEQALRQGHADLTAYSHAKGSRVAAIREAAYQWTLRR